MKVSSSARSVRSKDPLYEFKKATRKEVGRYDMPGELWEGRKEACAFGAPACALLVRARMLFGVEHIWRVAPTMFF